MFEAVGKHSVGEMSDEDLDEIERVARLVGGACGAQFTANTMATVSEAIGLPCHIRPGRPRLTRSATASAWRRAKRSWN